MPLFLSPNSLHVSCHTASAPGSFIGYCQLIEIIKELIKKKERRTRERKEAEEEEEWTMQCYAAIFVSVTSFQVWNRVCKRARYSPAREIGACAVENIPRSARSTERKRWACAG
jgi:hypothetical protein